MTSFLKCSLVCCVICTVCCGLFLGLGLTSAAIFSGGNIRIELGSIAMIALLIGGAIYAFIPAPKRLS